MSFLKKYITYTGIAGLVSCWATQAQAFWGTTEVDLKGISIIKEAAEILATAANQLPGKVTAIALLGLIIATVGIATLHKGLVNLLMPTGMLAQEKKENRARALVHVLMSFYFIFFGCLLMLCASSIAHWL